MRTIALFFTSSSGTHITPLDVLLQELLKKNALVYCLGTINNKEKIENIGGNFILYPPGSPYKEDSSDILKEYGIIGQKMLTHPEEGYRRHMELDTKYAFNITPEYKRLLVDIVQEKAVNVIFGDAVDKYGRLIAKELKIPFIGYITNNLYSKEFFETDPAYLYSVFMNGLRYEKYGLKRDFFKNYRKTMEELHDKYQKEFDSLPVIPLNQFDPMSKYSIIFSTNYLQPDCNLDKTRNYHIVYPQLERLEKLEDYSNFNESIKKFLKVPKKLVYISSGTLMSFSPPFYFKVIKDLLHLGYKVAISTQHYKSLLNQYCIEENFNIEDILIETFLPQKFFFKGSGPFYFTWRTK